MSIALPFVNPEEELTLLRIARDCLSAHVRREECSLAQYALTPRLLEKHGCFVTVRHGQELRGCIGHIRGILELAEAVRDNAISAGTRDPRFDPVRPEELPEISFEISVLLPGESPDSPFVRVQDISEIVLGRDGLYLDHAGPRGGGLLLPRVALDQGWDVQQFLRGLCHKAGVDETFWQRPEVSLYRFSTQSFSDRA